MLHQLDPSHNRRQHVQQHQHTLLQDHLAPHSTPSSSSSASSLSPALRASTPFDSTSQAPSLATTLGFGQDPVQESCSAVHHWPIHQDMSAMLEPPSPLLLNPTIVASQSQQPKPNPFPPHLSQYHDQGMVHPHHQHLQQPQQQLHHHRSVFQLQQQYNNQSNDEGERGRAGDNAAQGVHRKRSHSVPLLQQQLAAASSSLESSHLQEGQGGQGQEQGEGQGDDGDQDMEGTEDEGVTTITAMTSELMSDGPRTSGGATVYDYSALALPRESLLATLPRTHRHRVYASGAENDPTLVSSASDQPHPHALYYTLPSQSRAPALRFSRNNFAHNNNHHHGTSLYRENSYIRNRFPPYQQWPHSAQRDFHMATMGPLNVNGSPTSGITRSGLLSPASVLGTDAVLRSAIASSGSINKAATYKSRLPVHLRHMTSRSNRRSAICVNPFQPNQNASPHRQPQPQLSNISTPTNTVGQTDTDRLHPASVLSPRPLTPITTFNAANVAAAAALETMNQRKRISDWKRVSVQVFDMDENDPRQGIMRLSNAGTIGGGTVYSSGSSSSLTSSISSGGGGAHPIRGRHWMNQRAGLMNLTRVGPMGTAKTSNSQGAGSSAQSNLGTGQPTSTVDRLVEEMNKWSV
ncbi:hypothetical protein EMPS_06976 [Entomortierella parvispora]|uniref:Uncharacterized protein n=1 Tax=Entomortierella parvispora TaxID=205924 RepID=A0A9P3LY05_9FUNG|nr:hypothetical protein EMPS_06976 [Entomortierella parvispora]